MQQRLKIYTLILEGVEVEVSLKNVKNLNLRIYPPDGKVRLSAPHDLDRERIRLFLNEKLGWICQKQAEVIRQAQRQELAPPSFTEIEIFGKKFRIQQSDGLNKARFRKVNQEQVEITVRKGSSNEELVRFLEALALETLKQKIPVLIAEWQKVIGVEVKEWRLRKMKTRWGSCNPQARRIWLNTALAQKPLACLEYVIVHEMTHFLERRHNAHFYQLMDRFLPDWRDRRARLLEK